MASLESHTLPDLTIFELTNYLLLIVVSCGRIPSGIWTLERLQVILEKEGPIGA